MRKMRMRSWVRPRRRAGSRTHLNHLTSLFVVSGHVNVKHMLRVSQIVQRLRFHAKRYRYSCIPVFQLEFIIPCIANASFEYQSLYLIT